MRNPASLESFHVDNLAKAGRLNSTEGDERRHIRTVRDDILSHRINLIYEINQMVEILNDHENNGPSDATDDFSACINAD